MENKTTIHDIAKALNIDASTVSRALNNSPRVSQKTKEKILSKANELGYQRNLLASNLRKNKTNTIGVIVPRISRHFFSSVISGIEEAAFDAGYNVIICQSLEQLKREQDIVGTLLANRVAGVLLSVSMETNEYDHLWNIKNNRTPFLFFDRHCDIDGISSVLIDDFQGGFDATEHLILNGCKNIGHFSGPQELAIYGNRQAGYIKALEKHNIPYRPELVLRSSLMEFDGAEGAKTLLSLPQKIDGLFSANDIAAIGAMKYFKNKGIRIPDDIAIVGFSNEPISGIIDPSLTTIDQPGFQIGQISTKLLLEEINSSSKSTKGKTTILKSSLIERDSSKKLSK
ncbi:LacI family transcriptional regulator [Arenibacter sp. TNZ]|jgi:LacI family transcriptional regulator|uniref:LacI family DNA-binding transcriptional regulator n=1 Tax=Arenibacter TaxID=178469 RepID=UPI000CD49A8B|nr:MULTISPECIES: LacI family DNA-binding transcriptional regulator [Arenibacter]MCM4170178.1 LacI family transcriptional regulator [Arenibacter sp. TNZ]